jgi:UDPglucose 6-dehydrogenase
MKIGIIGMGFVGGTTAEVLGKAHEILPYDKYREPYKDSSALKNAEIVFVCVPTPAKPNGEMDCSAIHDSVKTLMEVASENKPVVVIRSTAVPGTTKKLEEKYPFHFVFNPEFLREKTALRDMLRSDRIVIGANRKEDYEKTEAVYKPLFPNASYIYVSSDTAEMIKYAANVMLIGQISIANEIYQICKAVGVDYNLVKQAILLDERIGRNLDVPGPDGSLGFGGKCFPKDLNALIYLAKENMYKPCLLEEIWRSNERVRKKKDWLDIPGAVSEGED